VSGVLQCLDFRPYGQPTATVGDHLPDMLTKLVLAVAKFQDLNQDKCYTDGNFILERKESNRSVSRIIVISI
jgi:hypothetical protein